MVAVPAPQRAPPLPAVLALQASLAGEDAVLTTGVIVQELLQGFLGPKDRSLVLAALNSLSFVMPDREDHVAAAELRNRCRRKGVQLGTIDALLAQLAIRHECVLLTTDQDFKHAARHIPLRVHASGFVR